MRRCCKLPSKATLSAVISSHVLRRLALWPLIAPVLAAFTTRSSPFLAAACLPALLLSIFLSSGQYAYGSTLLAPLVSPLAPFLALNLYNAHLQSIVHGTGHRRGILSIVNISSNAVCISMKRDVVWYSCDFNSC